MAAAYWYDTMLVIPPEAALLVSEVSQSVPLLCYTMPSCPEHIEPGRKSDTGTVKRIMSVFKIKHPVLTVLCH